MVITSVSPANAATEATLVKGGINPRNLTNVAGTLFFNAGTKLWKSDGTALGTVIVKDINPGGGGRSGPRGLTNVNGILFFTANDGLHGRELWKSDGTRHDTRMVKDIWPGATGSFPDPDSFPNELINVKGTLFFGADDGTHGHELWKSDGTRKGTVLVKDINTTANLSGSSAVGSLINLGGTLSFYANEGSTAGSSGRATGRRTAPSSSRTSTPDRGRRAPG